MQLTGSCSLPSRSLSWSALLSLSRSLSLTTIELRLASWLVWSVAMQLITRLFSLSLPLSFSACLSLHICVWSSLNTLRASVRGVDSESASESESQSDTDRVRVGVGVGVGAGAAAKATRWSPAACHVIHSFCSVAFRHPSVVVAVCQNVCQSVSQSVVVVAAAVALSLWPGQNKGNKALITIYIFSWPVRT